MRYFRHSLLGAKPGASGLGVGRQEAAMNDLPIWDVPNDVVAGQASPVSAGDLTCFADIFSDLADPHVMSHAWR
jgi:hypothetical protein